MFAEKISERVLVERPAQGWKVVAADEQASMRRAPERPHPATIIKTKPSNPAKSENEGFEKSRLAHARQAGLILLFAEKLVPHSGTTTSAIKPVS